MEQNDANKQHIDITPNFKVKEAVLNFISHDYAENYKMVPLEKIDNVLYVGAIDPNNLKVRDALNFIALNQGFTHIVQKISQEQLDQVLKQYTEASSVMSDVLEKIEGDETVILGLRTEEDDAGDTIIQEEAPIVKFVSVILARAVTKGASDIHIEPREKESVVRYRIDGTLQQELTLPRKVHDTVLARIKHQTGTMRIDEKRKPQDGRMSSIINNKKIDFRVASFPTYDGEKFTLRVLDSTKGLIELSKLGFKAAEFGRISRAVKRPYGLILATGPTGAGKTTTLYSLLNMVDRKTNNVVSLEDPVEYRLEGVNQSNIQPRIDYTFANGLRSVLRGDPDQILVGEIRDKETAHLAVQAALTGHLVYSTLHTNTAIGAVARLINFGIDPFLLAPTLGVVIGQRMVRLIEGESKDMPINDSMRRKIEAGFADLPKQYRGELPELKSFKEAIPTKTNPSGLKGRTGVFEVLEITDALRPLLHENASEEEMYRAARKEGYMTMGEHAILKGLQGKIPLPEVIRVSNENLAHETEEEKYYGNLPEEEVAAAKKEKK